MNIEIHRAGPGDLDRVAGLFDAYRQFYSQPTDPAGARRFLAERMRNDESVILLATADGEAAGFTQLYPMFTSVGMRRLWLLNDLFVAPGARRTGVATQLMQAAHDHAARTGAAGVMLETGKSNHQAAALYRKLGYELNEATDFHFLTLA